MPLDCLLREQNWAQPRAEHVTVDRCGRMALLLDDRQRGDKVKTGYNQGAEVSMVVTKRVMKFLLDESDAGDLLIPLTPARFRRTWASTLNELGLCDLGPPHGIRHAGAAHFVSDGGDLDEVRLSPPSVQRYTKGHVPVRKLASRGERFWEAPAATMAMGLASSTVGSRPLATRLVAMLDGVKGDTVDLGVYSSSTVHPEVGEPQMGRAARARRL